MNTNDTPIPVLWEQYLESRDLDIRNELITRYAYLVRAHAKKLAQRLSMQISLDEICAAAFDGLMTAVEAFDPERQVKFETYASRRIIGAVYDWIRSVDPQSRAVRQFERRRDEAMTLTSCDAGRQATSSEVAESMGLTQSQYNRYVRRSTTGQVIPLSSLDAENEAGLSPNRTDDSFPSPNQPAPSARIERDLLRAWLCRGLCASERTVLLLYYYDGLTMSEVGEVLGLSESRVSQIHKQLLKTLRGRFASKDAAQTIA